MTRPTFDQLEATWEATAEAIRTFNSDVKAQRIADFEASGGCGNCRGRGWVVTWDTLDCMQGGYHEHASCPEEACTHATRLASGLLPHNNKYDRLHGNSTWEMTHGDLVELNRLKGECELAHRAMEEERSRWEVAKGKLVEVVKKGGGRKKWRTPLGTIGLVARVFCNDFGTLKAVITTEDGQKFFPTIKVLEVIDPEPDTTPWDKVEAAKLKEEGVPVFMTVKRLGAKAALVVVIGQQQEQWLPLSQVPGLRNAVVGKATTAYVPVWLAKDKGFEIAGSKRV